MTKTANVAGSNLSRLISLSTVIFALPSADAFYHSSPLLVRQRNVVQQQRHHDSIAGIMIDPNLSSTAKSSSLNLSLLRGGATVAAATTAVTSSTTVSSILLKLASDSSSLFNSCLLGLALTTAVASSVGKVGLLSSKKSVAKVDADDVVTKKPASVRSLQIRFLAVFWLLRCADWLQGPYFYEVYASKVLSNGLTTSTTLIGRLFLAGFASTAAFGPIVGRFADRNGRRLGTLLFAALYVCGAASVRSSVLGVLFLGRMLNGIGTSLLFSAPEAWLVGEATKDEEGEGGKYLGETFGLAYAGDSIVAILAGLFAGTAATKRGPTGPFDLSIVFLVLGSIMASLLWKENVATQSSPSKTDDSETTDESKTTTEGGKPTIREAVNVIRSDPRIVMVGIAQSLFEAAMYVFVLQWPPAISKALSAVFGSGSVTPYGKIFSCLMASCLLGSTLFGRLTSGGGGGKKGPKFDVESLAPYLMGIASIAVGVSSFVVSGLLVLPPKAALAALLSSFFLFETCVGAYFPSIGTLRSRYLPDSHRGSIMALFGVPLNVLVVCVFLGIKRLGVGGALGISSGVLGIASVAMANLRRMTADGKDEGK